MLVATTSMGTDEAFAIGRSMAAMAAEVIESKNPYTDEFERIRRTEPMSLAAEMRWALLPPLTFRSPRAHITGILAPCYDIAGDAFDYAVNGDTADLAIFDAVGHGLEAARVADLAIAAYRHSRRNRDDLASTAVAIDDAIADQFERAIFVTALLAQLDLETGRLQWVNAGHPLSDHPAQRKDRRGAAHPSDDSAGSPWSTCGRRTGRDPSRAARHRAALQRRGHRSARTQRRLLRHRGPRRAPGARRATGFVQSEALRRLVARLTEFQDGKSRDDATLLLVTWRPADT